MREGIVHGAIFPDYELTDHTATRRRLSEIQGANPRVFILSRGGFCPKDRRQAEGLVQLHREMEVGYCQLVNISTDNLTEPMSIARALGLTGPFCRIRDVISKRTWISRNTQIRCTIR